MKVLILSSFVLAIYGLGCEENCDTCTDVHDIATISCDVAKTACTIANRDGYADTEEETAKVMKLLEDPPIVKITADECRQKCQEQADTEGTADAPAPESPDEPKFCKFFRWELGHEATAMKAMKPTTCSLQTTCPDSSSYCANYQCVSGQLGCNDNCDPLTPCTLASTTEWTHDKFHVICTDLNMGDVNIYSKAGEIANGTICNTIRKCSEWKDEEITATSPYYRKLAIECINGDWKPRADAGSQTESQAMIVDVGDDHKIEEQPCTATCEPLQLTVVTGDQWWADLVCDHPLAEGNVLTVPNSCILLCDNHLFKTIDCKYTENGDKTWQDADGNDLADKDIQCE